LSKNNNETTSAEQTHSSGFFLFSLCLRELLGQHAHFGLEFDHGVLNDPLFVFPAQDLQAGAALLEAAGVFFPAGLFVLHPLGHLVSVVLAGAVDPMVNIG